MARLTTTCCIAVALAVCLAVAGCRSTSVARTESVPDSRESLRESGPSAAPTIDRTSPALACDDDVTDAITLVAAETDVIDQQTPVDVPPPENAAQTIDLSTALMLTAGRSPQVAFANARIEESRAQLDRAESLWLPSLRAGANYNKHEGRIQDVAGNVIETSRGSAYSGLGANAVGAGSPAVPGVLAQFHVTDAVFQPRIAQQTMRARDANARAAVNDSLP